MTAKRSSKSSEKPATTRKTAATAKSAAPAKLNKAAAATTGSVPTPTPAKAPTPSGPRVPDVQVVLTHDQIARKAYDIWLAKGRPTGQDQTNWHEAIQALQRDARVAAKSH
jgi:hypothetical protein